MTEGGAVRADRSYLALYPVTNKSVPPGTVISAASHTVKLPQKSIARLAISTKIEESRHTVIPTIIGQIRSDAQVDVSYFVPERYA
jgi:hypothetical protein